MLKKILPFVVVISFALLSVANLVSYGIPPTHDGEYHVMRIWQFAKVLSDGNIYPRWAPDFNNGFGIPLFNYVYPLPNYVGAFFHFLGFGFIDSFKLDMATASIVGSILMFLWAKKYWGDLGGVVSSVFYTFSPYHFLDIYVRGSVGEVWSLALAPGLFWAISNFYETKRKNYLILSSVFLGLIIYAHNILALVFFGFFILYSLFLISNSKNQKNDISNLLFIVFTGLGLAAPFWIPAIFETKYVVGLQIFDPTQNFPVIYKLIYSSWGYGFSGSGVNTKDQMSFQIGIVNLLALLASIILMFNSKEKRTLIFSTALFFLTTFFITPFSAVFWKIIPGASFIQFPWRLLSLDILLISFIVGSIITPPLLKNYKSRVFVAAILILLAVGYSLRYAKAPFYHKRADTHYLTRTNFTDGTNSPGDLFNTKWLVKIPKKAKNKIESADLSTKIKIDKLSSQNYIFETEATRSSQILINTGFFPGWQAKINGKPTQIENLRGRISIKIPKGKSSIRIYLGSTTIQKASYAYFLLSILLIIYITYENSRRRFTHR